MAALRPRLRGEFELESASGRRPPTRKAEALLAYLALRAGRAHRRDKRAAFLWGDKDDGKATRAAPPTPAGSISGITPSRSRTPPGPGVSREGTDRRSPTRRRHLARETSGRPLAWRVQRPRSLDMDFNNSSFSASPSLSMSIRRRRSFNALICPSGVVAASAPSAASNRTR